MRGILADETHWVAWKKNPVLDRQAGKKQACASFQRPPYAEAETRQKARSKRPGGESACRDPQLSCIMIWTTQQTDPCALFLCGRSS